MAAFCVEEWQSRLFRLRPVDCICSLKDVRGGPNENPPVVAPYMVTPYHAPQSTNEKNIEQALFDKLSSSS